MTEQEWLTCTDAVHVWNVANCESARKIHLFGCACVRFLWLLSGEEEPDGIEVAERFADGKASRTELRSVRHKAREEITALEEVEAGMRPMAGMFSLLETLADPSGFDAVLFDLARDGDRVVLEEPEWGTICALLRDIFGNPFRPVTFSPEWRTDTTVSLAKQMYESRDFSAAPILADALQDAGCDNEDILNHLRDATLVHVRGCWAVDLVLGRS